MYTEGLAQNIAVIENIVGMAGRRHDTDEVWDHDGGCSKGESASRAANEDISNLYTVGRQKGATRSSFDRRPGPAASNYGAATEDRPAMAPTVVDVNAHSISRPTVEPSFPRASRANGIGPQATGDTKPCGVPRGPQGKNGIMSADNT